MTWWEFRPDKNRIGSLPSPPCKHPRSPCTLIPPPQTPPPPSILSREGFCRGPRGIFPTEFRGEFCRGFLVDFFGPSSLEKKGGKNPPQNPRQFSNQNLGVSGPKSTLQGSGLDIFNNNRERAEFRNRIRPVSKKKKRPPPRHLLGRLLYLPS